MIVWLHECVAGHVTPCSSTLQGSSWSLSQGFSIFHAQLCSGAGTICKQLVASVQLQHVLKGQAVPREQAGGVIPPSPAESEM